MQKCGYARCGRDADLILVIGGRRVTFEQLDIYVKTLARLRYYTRGKLKVLFSQREHTSIEDLLSGVVVVEAGEMADVHKPFLMGLLALSAFYYRKFTGTSPVPEFIVLEEAHQVTFDPTVKGRRYAPRVLESVITARTNMQLE